MRTKLFAVLLVCGLLLITGCHKDFLDIKRLSNQVVPHTIADYQSILDNTSIMNSGSSHILGILGADEFFVNDGVLSSVSPYQRNGYIWNREIFEGEGSNDWNNAYERILHANIALEGLSKIQPQESETSAWNNVKGSALFFRAANFYQLAQLFCKPYNRAMASADLGIPLRLESDINLKSVRSTVAQTYEQILADLHSAADLLPEKPLVKKRPSKPAAYALLAKTYLLMEDYEQAEQYAAKSLDIQKDLIDLKMMDNLDANFPLASIPEEENRELIFLTGTTNISVIAPARVNIATALLELYTEGDLRREAWFFVYSGRTLFGGGYQSGYSTGLGVNEVVLIRAESRVRMGEVEGALADINYLLENRYDNRFEPLTIQSDELLLARILVERQKELVMRGVRWEDLRRLNNDSRFAKTLVRTVDGQRYELPPNDPRYIWPIPEQEILMSGLQQNER